MRSVMAGLLVDTVPSWPAESSRDDARTRASGPGAHVCGASHVVGPELFHRALARERSRAERFGEPFTVLRLDVSHGRMTPAVARGVAKACAAIGRPHLVGWITQDAAIGVLLPAFDRSHESLSDLDVRFRRELADCLGPEGAEPLLGWDVYTGRQAVDTRHVAAARPHRWRRTNDALKRALDVFGSAVLLVVLSPVFLVLAALVKLGSPGPALFRQLRLGEHARTFEMLKFRTMRVDAEHDLHEKYVSWFIQSSATASTTSEGQVFKLTDDPRVTPIGRFLRRTSLDELPQLWNVLVGQMSLVGPRPPLSYEVEQYKPWHCRRFLEAKPGITGLWQVNGRSRTTFDEMVRLDLRYARTQSLWTDIRILLATPRAVITGKGAY